MYTSRRLFFILSILFFWSGNSFSVRSSYASTPVSGGNGGITHFLSGIANGELFKTALSHCGPAAPLLAMTGVVFFLYNQAPDLARDMYRSMQMPFLLIRRTVERAVCGTHSLRRNEVAIAHNRMWSLIFPLTKQSNMVDLNKERRMRIIDQKEENIHDEYWKLLSGHIDKQLSFIIDMLDKSIEYYEYKRKSKKMYAKRSFQDVLYRVVHPLTQGVHEWIRSCIKISIQNDKEIVFYIGEIKQYLKEITMLCCSALNMESLDKDKLKHVLTSASGAFEHLTVLLDEQGAITDRLSGHLSLKKQHDSSMERLGGGSYPYYMGGSMYGDLAR